MNLKEPSSRLTRWKLKLAEYTFKTIYKTGKSNTNTDALSLIEINNQGLSSIVVTISDSELTVTAPDDRPIISTSSTDTGPSQRALSNPVPIPNPDPDVHGTETVHSSVEDPSIYPYRKTR